jgi:hypothetical protein
MPDGNKQIKYLRRIKNLWAMGGSKLVKSTKAVIKKGRDLANQKGIHHQIYEGSIAVM